MDDFFFAVFDHTSRAIVVELVLCTTLNVLRSENTMSQLSNAVFGGYFNHLERFLRHFENQKILTFWGELWGIFTTLPICRFQARFFDLPWFWLSGDEYECLAGLPYFISIAKASKPVGMSSMMVRNFVVAEKPPPEGKVVFSSDLVKTIMT